jgi:hypothetical protein
MHSPLDMQSDSLGNDNFSLGWRLTIHTRDAIGIVLWFGRVSDYVIVGVFFSRASIDAVDAHLRALLQTSRDNFDFSGAIILGI